MMYFLVFLIIPIGMYAACDSTWTKNASGDWTDTSNWTPNCYPGSAGPTDIATFGSSPTNPLTVTLDTNISLQQFIFDKSYYASPFYTISPDTTEVFTLNDPSPLFSVLHGVHEFNTECNVTATNTLHITISDPLGNLIFTAPLTTTNSAIFSGPGTMTHHSLTSSGNTLTFGGDFTLESGILHNINDVMPTADGTIIRSLDSVFIQNGVIAIFENTADMTGSGGSGASLTANNSIVMNGGSFTASNTGNITNTNAGVSITSGVSFQGGLIDIGGGSLQIFNGGIISDSSFGVLFGNVLGVVRVRDGVITIQNTNTVSDASNGCAFGAIFGLLIIDNGTIIAENSGNVNDGVGCFISGRNCIMTGGSITLTNYGSISNGGRGSVLNVEVFPSTSGAFIMTGGQITLNDFGTVAPDGSVGAGIISATINQTGGTITNNATILSDIYTIGSGGLLQGIGVINDINQLNAANVFNGGTLHPGIPLGTMTIFGNYTQTNGGTLGIDITPTGASSLLAVSGNVTISTDTTVFVTPEFGTYQSGTTYTIVTNGGAQAGRFSHLTFAYPTFSGHLVYNPHDILLVLDLIPFADFLTGNAKNVAECFQTLTSPDALAISTALTFSSVATIQAAFNAMDPAQFTTLSVAQENANIRVLHGIAFHAGCRSLWIDAFGDLAKQKGKATLPGYKERMGGVILGYDFWRSGRLSLGTALAYTRDHLKWSNARGHASMQTAYFALYGDIHCDHFSSHFALSEGWNAYQETRNIRFPGVNRTAKSHHTGNETAIQASLEHPIKRDCFSFIPHTDLYYIFLHEKGYSEKGANSLDYTYRPKNSDLFRTTIGASIQHTFCRITHEFTLNWIYQTNFRGNELRASFTENPNCVFEVTGLQPSHNLISPAFSLRFCPTSCLTFGLLYVGEFGKNYRNQEVHLSFACNF